MIQIDKDCLEVLIDKYSIETVLDTLGEISLEKADHIRSCYENSNGLINCWIKISRYLFNFTSKIRSESKYVSGTF